MDCDGGGGISEVELTMQERKSMPRMFMVSSFSNPVDCGEFREVFTGRHVESRGI